MELENIVKCKKCEEAGRDFMCLYTGDGKDFLQASREIDKSDYVVLECNTVVDQTPDGKNIPGTKRTHYFCNHRHNWNVAVG